MFKTAIVEKDNAYCNFIKKTAENISIEPYRAEIFHDKESYLNSKCEFETAILSIETLGECWAENVKFIQKNKCGKIILTTEKRSFENIQQAIRMNIMNMLIKPFRKEEVENNLLDMKSEGAQEKTIVECGAIKSDLANKAVAYIGENYNRGITLKEMSEDLNVSNWHLCKVLKANTNKTFVEILTEVRTEKAKKLLLETDMAINEIAAQVGFSEITYFVNLFKKQTGVSPGTFRACIGEIK